MMLHLEMKRRRGGCNVKNWDHF